MRFNFLWRLTDALFRPASPPDDSSRHLECTLLTFYILKVFEKSEILVNFQEFLKKNTENSGISLFLDAFYGSVQQTKVEQTLGQFVFKVFETIRTHFK